MKKLIKVTKANIKNGNHGCSGSCPVTLALRDSGIDGVGLGKNDDYVFNYTINRIDPAPRSVRRFAKAFDTHKKVKPFAFYFDMDIVPNV